MRAFVALLAMFAVSGVLHAQSVPASGGAVDPLTLGSEESCVSECEAVYSDCREQCGEDTMRARDERLDPANGPIDACLKDCKNELALCMRTCGKAGAE